MLETSAARLGQKGGPHFGCASKIPSVRIDMIARAGELAVPFTTGILQVSPRITRPRRS
jgi:FO synthase